MKNKFINKEIYYSIAIFLMPLVILFSIYLYTNLNKNISDLDINQSASIINTSSEYIPKPFDNQDVVAKAAIVKNINTGEILFEKQSDLKLPLASITKFMTALVIYMNVEDLSQKVSISPNSFLLEGNTFLRIGEKFSMKDLIDYMLISSSNHSAAAIAETYEYNFPGLDFIDEMNRVAQKIGMSSSHFSNVTGLDRSINTAGSFGTASDVAVLFEFILRNYPEMVEVTNDVEFKRFSESGILHQLRNTNQIISELPNLIASKTGFTDLAGGNLGVIVDPGVNNPHVIVVLGSGRNERFGDVLNLSNLLIEHLKR